MRCPSCDKDNSDKARFCIHCGTKLSKDPEKAEVNKTAASSASENTTKKIESDVDSQNDSLGSVNVTSISIDEVSKTKSENSSLKNAVATNKKRSRRRVPLVIVVALALALSASVAFAAYYVYTEVWLPSQQEQGQQTSSLSNSIEQNTVSQASAAAFDEVIKEYQSLIDAAKENPNVITPDYIRENYTYIDEAESTLWQYHYDSFSYIYTDLNGDGASELLIGIQEAPTVNSPKPVMLSSVWAFQDNTLVHALQEQQFNLALLCKDKFLLHGNALVFDDNISISGTGEFCKLNTSLSNINNAGDQINLTISDSFIHGNGTHGPKQLVDYEIKQSGKVIDSGQCSTEKINELSESFLSKHPLETISD